MTVMAIRAVTERNAGHRIAPTDLSAGAAVAERALRVRVAEATCVAVFVACDDDTLERVRAVMALGPDGARAALARNAAATAAALHLPHDQGHL